MRVADPPGSAPRVLFARPDHLGDVLLTLPAVAALKRVVPAARIAYAVPSDVAAAPAHCRYVDDVVAVEFPPLDRPWPADGTAVRAAAESLRGRFDVALLSRPDDPWSGRLVAEAAIPVRVGFDMPRTRGFLTCVVPAPEGRHATLLAMDAVAAIWPAVTSQPASPVPGLFLPTPEERAEADAVRRETGDDAPLLLHPGSGWPLKNWPPARFGRLAARVCGRYGLRPLVLGTRREQALVDMVVASSGGCALGLAGRLSLGGLAALQARACAAVGTDSGPLQLAALMGCPTVAVYGPADPAVFAVPGRCHVVRVALPCSPCGTLEHPPCGARRDPACITGIGVDAVGAAVDAVLASRHRAATGRVAAPLASPTIIAAGPA
jgi:ADP-heptose:LPS heptosyltransferase